MDALRFSFKHPPEFVKISHQRYSKIFKFCDMPHDHVSLYDMVSQIFHREGPLSISYSDLEGDVLTILNDQDLVAAYGYAS